MVHAGRKVSRSPHAARAGMAGVGLLRVLRGRARPARAQERGEGPASPFAQQVGFCTAHVRRPGAVKKWGRASRTRAQETADTMHQGSGDLGAQEGKALTLQHAQEAGPARRVPGDRAPTGKQGSLRAQRDGGHAPPAAVSRAGRCSRGLGSLPPPGQGPGRAMAAASCLEGGRVKERRAWDSCPALGVGSCGL